MDREKSTIKRSTRRFKKYMVKVGKEFIHFGDTRFQHYKDKTPIKLYSNLDHLDKERRHRYYLRHGISNDKNSAKYWASKYLW